MLGCVMTRKNQRCMRRAVSLRGELTVSTKKMAQHTYRDPLSEIIPTSISWHDMPGQTGNASNENNQVREGPKRFCGPTPPREIAVDTWFP